MKSYSSFSLSISVTNSLSCNCNTSIHISSSRVVLIYFGVFSQQTLQPTEYTQATIFFYRKNIELIAASIAIKFIKNAKINAIEGCSWDKFPWYKLKLNSKRVLLTTKDTLNKFPFGEIPNSWRIFDNSSCFLYSFN